MKKIEFTFDRAQYLALKSIVTAMEQLEYQNAIAEGWTPTPEKKDVNYRIYHNVTVAIVSVTNDYEGKIGVVFKVIKSANDLVGKNLIYLCHKTNKTLISKFNVGSVYTLFSVTLAWKQPNVLVEEKKLLTGKIMYRTLFDDMYIISRLESEKRKVYNRR